MITPKEAYKKARKEALDFPFRGCLDIGDRYAFFFSPEPPPPGLPIITVNKTSGSIDFLSIPPLENLDLLDKGTEIKIDFKEKKKKTIFFKKRTCKCCGKRVLDKDSLFEICPICGWESDAVQEDNPDLEGGANEMSLNQYKEQYVEKNYDR